MQLKALLKIFVIFSKKVLTYFDLCFIINLVVVSDDDFKRVLCPDSSVGRAED